MAGRFAWRPLVRLACRETVTVADEQVIAELDDLCEVDSLYRESGSFEELPRRTTAGCIHVSDDAQLRSFERQPQQQHDGDRG
jgi:hypothetical protein